MSAHRSGFTLVEIVAVMVIGFLMAAVSYPRLVPARESAQMGAAKQQVAAALTTARAAAVRRGGPVALSINGNTIRLVGVAINGSLITLDGPFPLDSIHGVALSSSASSITFDSRGVAAGVPVAGVKLVLSNASRRDSICVSRAGMVMTRGCL
ncbi:MAG: type II secretion system protein [Gemmatimonadaceae bacterium]